MQPKFNYPQHVKVSMASGEVTGQIKDTSVTTKWNRENKQHEPTTVMHLVDFGEGCACWLEENKVLDTIA